MSNNAHVFIKKGCFVFIEFILALPILFIAGKYTVSNIVFAWISSLFLLFILGYICSLLIHDRMQSRLVYSMFILVIGILFTMTFSQQIMSIAILLVVHILILYRSKQYTERTSDELLTSYSLWVIGFPIYFLAYFIYRYFETLQPYLNLVTWGGVLFIIITLFFSNNGILKASTLSKQKKPFVSETIKRKNQFYIIGLLGVVLLLTNIGIVKSVLYKAFSLFMSGILWILSLFTNGDEPIQTPSAADQSLPANVQSVEPSTFAVILEKMMYIAFFIVGIILCIFLILYGGRKLGHYIKLAYSWLIKRVNQLFDGPKNEQNEVLEYTDEKESLIDFNKLKNDMKEKVKNRIRHRLTQRPKWGDLSDRERVRYVYQQLVKDHILQGYAFKPSHTPNETLNNILEMINNEQPEYKCLINSYGKARYGNKELSEQEVESIKYLFELKIHQNRS